MKDRSTVFVHAGHAITPVGIGWKENFDAICSGHAGVKKHHRPDLDDNEVWASLFDEQISFDALLQKCFEEIITVNNIPISNEGIGIIISSTKGNIGSLQNEQSSEDAIEKASLPFSADLLREKFSLREVPTIISNACISGVSAIQVAKRYIEAGRYHTVVVIGADIITPFIYSGFKAFQALSQGRCKPFSESRDGINLGEGAAAMILSSEHESEIKVGMGMITNDSNHISGPSRTGEELGYAIQESIRLNGVDATSIDFISAHGTATVYNDEMEAKAFHLAGVGMTPVHSLKGYFGHTLGAAGILESLMAIYALKENVMIPSVGFDHNSLTPEVNVISHLRTSPMKNVLKTASGFGGCNAAMLFSKV